MTAKEKLMERLNPKVIAGEILGHLAERVIPQGAAELASALNTGVGFVPYGPGQQPAEVEAGGVSPSPTVSADAPEATTESAPASPEASPPSLMQLSDPLQRAAANAHAAEARGKARDLEIA